MIDTAGEVTGVTVERSHGETHGGILLAVAAQEDGKGLAVDAEVSDGVTRRELPAAVNKDRGGITGGNHQVVAPAGSGDEPECEGFKRPVNHSLQVSRVRNQRGAQS